MAAITHENGSDAVPCWLFSYESLVSQSVLLSPAAASPSGLIQKPNRDPYDEESDVLFPASINNLRRWVAGYWVHYSRFSGFREDDHAQARARADGSVNDALGERLRFEVLENRERLNVPDISKATAADIQTLCDQFHEWVVGVGADPADEPPESPRLCNFLVVDAESLRALASVPEELLPHAVAVDFEKFMSRRRSKCYAGYVRDFVRGIETSPQDRGWMKTEARDLHDAWFLSVRMLMKGDGEGKLECCETTESPGDFWRSGSAF